jgi:hypothetical protein
MNQDATETEVRKWLGERFDARNLIVGSPTTQNLNILWRNRWEEYWPVDIREKWIWADNPHDIGGARSRIIHLAKHGGTYKNKTYKPLGPKGIMIQNDTDVMASDDLPFDQLMEYIRDDIQDGWGMVCAPTAVMIGKKGVAQFTPKGAIYQDKPFEVELAGFGIVAIPQSVLYELAPYDQRQGMDGQIMPIYCSWNARTGEDKDLLDRVAKIAPVCIDPRLKTMQKKEAWFNVGGLS